MQVTSGVLQTLKSNAKKVFLQVRRKTVSLGFHRGPFQKSCALQIYFQK